MKLRNLLLATTCLFAVNVFAQQSESSHAAKMPAQVGKMSTAEFQQINEKGAQMVTAITPTSDKLSAADLALFNQVAMGGMRQLAISQAVVDKATSDRVRMLAQSEIDEQTTLSAKLKEVASAKGATLPDAPAPEVTALVDKINSASGAEVDAMYLEEGGIKGHELLQTTMTTVRSSANDATLKALSEATLPVIKTHLAVSKDERKAMKK